MGELHRVDGKTWKRKKIADFFGSIDEPRFSVTAPVDVTKLYKYCEINGIFFYYSMVYLSAKAISAIPEFHYKIQNDGVFMIDDIAPSFTDLKKGTTDFYICILPIHKDETIIEYAKRAKEYSLSTKDFMNNPENCMLQEMVFMSCLPWMDFTSIVKARKIDKNDSTVHLAWGKYIEENGKLRLHYEVQVNHRLCDGLHIGLFINKLQELIDNLDC